MNPDQTNSRDTRAALLIALPDGLNVSGVTTWAVRLVNGLAARGRRVGLIVHAEPAGQSRLSVRFDSRVRVFSASGVFPLRESNNLSAHVRLYARAVHEMRGRVVLSPNLDGNCYGVSAGVSQEDPDVRVIGWQHSDIAYDARVLEWYQDVLCASVGVSDAISATLSARIKPVYNIPYGVEVTDQPPTRHRTSERLRLLYAGRLEHLQKRVLSLPAMSDVLSSRGIRHTLTVAGDGPARESFLAAIQERPCIQYAGRNAPWQVRELLASHDALILPSRYEGLSVSMLEAMAAGCVPIVAGVRSGAGQAIEHGVSGIIAEATPDMDEHATAAHMALGVSSFLTADRDAMSRAAWDRARIMFGLDNHLDAVERVMDMVAELPPRHWPADRPLAFTGTVPADGPVRLRAALASIGDRLLAVHCVGAHTRELWSTFRACGARVAAFTDDDRQHHGGSVLGIPVVSPADVAATGATDVLISSWMHEEAIWSRREVYERQGLRVHAIYRR